MIQISGKRRRGFAFRDLLACLFMFVIGLAVVVPGCGQTRRTEGLQQTHNNLRQLGIALHNSEAVYKKLPPAFGRLGPAEKASIHVHLLPFEEQNALYNSFLQGGTAAVEAVSVPPYLAAADPTTVGGGKGQTNFAANIRVFSDTARRSPPNEEAKILASDTMSYGLGNAFPDGAAHTIIFATRFSQGKSGAPTDTVRTLIAADPTSASGAFFGGHRPRVTAQAACPRGQECTFQNLPTQADAMMTPSHYGHSYSPAGLSVCMADLIVRQTPVAMSIDIWQRLVHPDDGEKIKDSDWE